MFSGPKDPEGPPLNCRGGIAAKDRQLSQQATQGKDAAAGIKIRERKFENGDKYRGGWLSGLPEGEGKYEWSDGSCYEGGWKGGHKHGVGKYTWNSGASYQGEWLDGFMHGIGIFEAPDGSKYQGGWREDLKHGLGRKIYANGDVYEGLWCNGKPDGPGRYIWVDFNEYDGEWCSGRLHGQGTFVWKTGERYDGEWKDGQEDGVGMFTFRDGSTYEGFWRKGKKHGVGIFRPAAALPSSAMRSLKGRWQSGMHRGPAHSTYSSSQAPSTGRSAFADATAAAAALPDEAAADYVQAKRPNKPQSSNEPSAGEGQQQPRVTHPGSAKSMSSMGALDPATMSALQSPRNRRDQVTLKEYSDGRLIRQQVLSPAHIAAISSSLSSSQSSSSGSAGAAQSSSSSRQQVTPLGDVLFLDHSVYDLLVQLQLGIRWSVTSAALDYASPAAMHSELQPPDYATTVKQEFPRAGSRSTPVHPAADFVWKDYAPAAFRVLRELAGVEQHDFINQLCGDQALRLLSPPSHSDAMFFLSADERFIIRTITCAEKKVLLAVLQRYAEHLRRCPNSLLTRFYGLHRVSAPPGGLGKKVRFLVMGNIFCTQLPIQLRFDLKGCTRGRTVGVQAAKGSRSGIVLKDLDLQQQFKLEQGAARRVHEQLEADTRLLSSVRVMDYSMLLGVHQPSSDSSSSTGSKSAGRAQQQQNFAEHSNEAGLSAAVSRMESQLGRLQLDKWAHAALLQLGRTNLLMGLAAAGGKPGGNTARRGNITRSPTLVLATRPKRSHPSRRAPAAPLPATLLAAPAAADSTAAGSNAAATAAAGAAAAAGTVSSSKSRKLLQPQGQGVAAVAEPSQGSGRQATSSAAVVAAAGQQQPPSAGQQQEVVLYFGIIDILQAYTLKKRLESYMRRVVSSASTISAVGPSFYAARFRTAMKHVFK